MRPTTPRLTYLDGMRALAALFVLVHHAWLTVYGNDHPGTLMMATTGWMGYGHSGVAIFIVLSGYSLTLGVIRRGTLGSFARYIGRRARRVVLPYWAALAMSVLLGKTLLDHQTGTVWDSSVPFAGRDVVMHILLLHDLSGAYLINHPMWSIALEWHIYFLLPCILFARRWFGTVLPTVVLVVVTCFLGQNIRNGAQFVGLFALGIAACYAAHGGGAVAVGRRQVSVPWHIVSFVIAIPTVAVMATLGIERTVRHNATFDTLLGLALSSLLVALACGQVEPMRRALSWNRLVEVGVFSYSIYLLHAPIVQLVWQYISQKLGVARHSLPEFAIVEGISVPASLAAAWAFYLLIERRCMSASKRRGQELELAAAAAPMPS